MLENEGLVENEETSNIETIIEEKEVVLESVEDILSEEKTEEIEETVVESNMFVKELLSGVIDQIAVMAVSLIILLVFNLILKIFGYYIAEKQPMFLIIYIIINVIYAPVCKRTKMKETLSKKILLNK